jgi:hypothetical protein
MANVVLDPKIHPEAIIPDLTTPDPLVAFTKNDIAFVYGSKWKQRPRPPNACTVCHTDKSNAWAIETLRTWPEFSAGRELGQARRLVAGQLIELG